MLESLSYVPPKPRKDKKLSVVFRPGDGLQVGCDLQTGVSEHPESVMGHIDRPMLQHCAGVNAVAVSQDGHDVYTASRDATVMRSALCSGIRSCMQLGHCEH